MSAERRRAPRYQFVAQAEVLESGAGTRAKVKTGDLSIGGCFIDTLNPSPEGTEIQVTIYRATRSFTACGRVVFVFPRLGMGVAFTRVEEDQLPTLEDWLAELERSRFARVGASPTSGQDEKS
jgi:PilZ domain